MTEARNQFYRGDVQKAVETLQDENRIPKRNKLLLFMEKGMALHEVGDYKGSIETLLKASELIREQDVISVTKQSASLITSEWVMEYKGEYSERLWVHTYLMMNFLLTGQNEEALVEAKQALQMYDDFPEPLKKDYFSRALIALCFESLGEINGAYIEYKKLSEALSDASIIAPELYRLAVRLGFSDDALIYEKMISEAYLSYLKENPSSELVVFIGTGSIPKKVPGDIVIPPAYRFSFPQYLDVERDFNWVEPFESFRKLQGVTVVTNAGEVVKSSLEDRRASVIIKETARVAAKELIARKVDDDAGAAVGALLRIAFFAMEEADTRCWQTLPRSLALLRVPLEPGDHKIQIDVSGKGGMNNKVMLPEFKLDRGSKVFFSIRLGENFSLLSTRME